MIGVVSDMHLKESRGYAGLVKDRRADESEAVLNSIVEIFADCEAVVLLGDMLNSRNNHSSVIRRYVRFLEDLGDKQLYILAGNHEKFAEGSSAIDFLKEIKGKDNWHIITTGPVSLDGMTFLPYMHKAELAETGWPEASEKLMGLLEQTEGTKILFTHTCLSGSVANGDTPVESFYDVILHRDRLDRFDLVIGGHIHVPQEEGKFWVVGSVFADEVGEGDRSVLKIDGQNVTRVTLPGRRILKLTDPKGTEKIRKKGTILKVELTKKLPAEKMDELTKWLEGFDAYTLVENYGTSRRRTTHADGFERLPMERMLDEYAKVKKVDRVKLKEGWDIVTGES